MRMPARPSATSEVIAATSAWVCRESRRSRRPMRLTGTRAKANTAQTPMVSGQSMVRSTAKVATMVRMPERPPSIDRTEPPIRPMSAEKRAARPAGASVCSRARSVPTRRANMVLRSSASMRLVTRLRRHLLDVLAEAVGAAQADHPERPPPDHRGRALLVGGHDELDELRVAGGGERHHRGHRQRQGEHRPVRRQPVAPEAAPRLDGADGFLLLHRRCASMAAGRPPTRNWHSIPRPPPLDSAPAQPCRSPR